MLMRQIEREVDLLDWTNSKSHTLVPHHETYRPPPISDQTLSGTTTGPDVHRLGGEAAGLHGLLPARLLAGTAAILRTAEEEKEFDHSMAISEMLIDDAIEVVDKDVPQVEVVDKDVPQVEVVDKDVPQVMSSSCIEEISPTTFNSLEDSLLSSLDDTIALTASLDVTGSAPVDQLLRLRQAVEVMTASASGDRLKLRNCLSTLNKIVSNVKVSSFIYISCHNNHID